LKDGAEVEGVRYGPIEATVDKAQGANVWLSIGLREGKNREVRKILGTLGLDVNRLIRVSFGPFQLLDLEPGAVEAIQRRVLIDQLGAKLAAELGLSAETDPQRGGQRSLRPAQSGPAERAPNKISKARPRARRPGDGT
jgi:23S rRNA pseudouridine2605 synthase